MQNFIPAFIQHQHHSPAQHLQCDVLLCRAVNGTSRNFTVLGEGPYKEHCDILPLTALVLSS